MPHKQALHLPSMLTAKAVYERMQLDLVQTISQAQFYKLWSQHFPHVTIPAVSALLLPRGGTKESRAQAEMLSHHLTVFQ